MVRFDPSRMPLGTTGVSLASGLDCLPYFPVKWETVKEFLLALVSGMCRPVRPSDARLGSQKITVLHCTRILWVNATDRIASDEMLPKGVSLPRKKCY